MTDPNFVLGPATKGTRTNIENLDESAKYSWVKSPRWKGNAVEVGPLARYLVAYARGNKEIQEQVNGTLKALDVPITRALLDARPHGGPRPRVPVGRAQDAATSTTS